LDSLDEVDRIASGDDLILRVGDDSLRLMNYLRGRNISDLGNVDVLL